MEGKASHRICPRGYSYRRTVAQFESLTDLLFLAFKVNKLRVQFKETRIVVPSKCKPTFILKSDRQVIQFRAHLLWCTSHCILQAVSCNIHSYTLSFQYMFQPIIHERTLILLKLHLSCRYRSSQKNSHQARMSPDPRTLYVQNFLPVPKYPLTRISAMFLCYRLSTTRLSIIW